MKTAAMAFKVSLQCEEGGNRLRKRERSNVHKRVARLEQYHALLTSSALDDFERNSVMATPTAEANRPKSFPDAAFSAKKWGRSCGEDFYKLGKDATRLSTTHQLRMGGFLSRAAFLQVGGEWARHSLLWGCPSS